MPTATTFTLFPLLPVEIRRQIWQQTFRPQLIDNTHIILAHLAWPSTPPAIFVSHESRREALRFYHPLKVKIAAAAPQTRWCSPRLDTVQISASPQQDVRNFDVVAAANPWFGREIKRLEIWDGDLAEGNMNMDYRMRFCGARQEPKEKDLLPFFEQVEQVVFRFWLPLNEVPTAETRCRYERFLTRVWDWYGKQGKYKPWLGLKAPEFLIAAAREGRVLAKLKNGEAAPVTLEDVEMVMLPGNRSPAKALIEAPLLRLALRTSVSRYC